MLYCNIIAFFFSKFNRQLNIRHPRRFISKLNYSLAELTFGFHRTIPENNLGILLIQRHLDQNEIPKTRKKCSILENCTIKTNCWWLSSMIWSDHLAKEAFSLKFIFLFSSIIFYFPWYVLRKKCPYLEIFWSIFSRIRTEYGEIWSISPQSVTMRENTDQNNSKYGNFSCSDG